MIRLVVWITLPSGQCVRCGEMVCATPAANGRIAGAFRYDAQWLAHPAAFPLDPVYLPLAETEFACDRPRGVFAVFEDSLPDDWGRRLLIRKAGLDRARQNTPHLLLALNGTALGALSYYTEDLEPRPPGHATAMELEALVEAALRYEDGQRLDDDSLQLLFAAASSPGGARPKALVQDDAGQGWLAKFPSSRDRLAMIPIEAATLALARRAGLVVPDFRIEACGRHPVLMVARFDLTPRGGRRHMISFQTLLGVEGHYVVGYPDLFDALRRIAARPAEDLAALYRQMVFNAFIGNTDDHLKNFCLLCDDRGFRLSPSYDLLPDTADRREHVLHFAHAFHFPGRDQLIAIGRQARVPACRKIVEEVRMAAAGWKTVFAHWQVPAADIERLAPGIDARLK